MTSPTLSNLARRALVTLLLIGTVLAGCTSNPDRRVLDVAIDQPDFGLVVGESSAPLTATVDAEAGTSTAVNWSSDDEGVATVAPSGIVTGVGAGTARITATSVADATRSDSITVIVTDGPAVISVTIESGDLTLAPGDVTPPLDVTVVVTGGADPGVHWTSDDEGVATVDPNGVVTAVAAGTTRVNATSTLDGARSDSVLVTVRNPPTIDGFTATVVRGSRLDLAWTASDADEFDVLAVLDGDPSDTLVIESGLTGTGATIDIPASDRQTLRLVAKGLGPDATAEVVPGNVVTRADDYDPYDLQPEISDGRWPELVVPGTLRDVVAKAPTGTVVGFASDIGTVTLDGVDVENIGPPGNIDAHLIVRDDIIISGPTSRVTIEGTHGCPDCGETGEDPFTWRSRMIFVMADTDVTIENVVLTGGTFIFDGGGIRNDGFLTIRDSEVSGNRAWYKGGAVFNSANARLDVIDSDILRNEALTENYEVGGNYMIRGGSLASDGAMASDGWGGAIWNDPGGVVNVVNSQIANNRAKVSGGGLVNVSDESGSGRVTITDSEIVDNVADQNVYDEAGLVSHGGGIYNAGILSMSASTLSRNVAANQGGGLYHRFNATTTLDTVTIQGNVAGTGVDAGVGGGIRHLHFAGEEGRLSRTDVTLVGNDPDDYAPTEVPPMSLRQSLGFSIYESAPTESPPR